MTRSVQHSQGKRVNYEAFSRVIGETAKLIPVEIFAYAIMATHWHMVLRPTVVQFKSRRFRALAMGSDLDLSLGHGGQLATLKFLVDALPHLK